MSFWKFIRTMGHNAKKWDNPVLNRTYGHPHLDEFLISLVRVIIII